MNLKHLTEYVQILFLIFATFGGFGLVAGGLRFLKTKTKNTQLAMALSWAEQACVAVDSYSNENGDVKHQKASNVLAERLEANGLSGFFNRYQIEQLIEYGYANLKNNGVIEQSKKTVATNAKPISGQAAINPVTNQDLNAATGVDYLKMMANSQRKGLTIPNKGNGSDMEAQ